MIEVIDFMTDKLSASVPQSEAEYIGEDGLLRCAKCHRKTQTEVEFLGRKKIVRCICDCRKKELDSHKDRERKEELDRQRRICFAETNMASWTFENDDGKNPRISNAMRNYVKKFTEFRKEGKGLLLYGSCGTGKTYLAACVANALIDEGCSVLMTNFARLTNQIQGKFDGKQEYIDSLNKYTLLIIDDLGAERQSEYMQEMVFNIIDARYRSGLPMIITTNLSVGELRDPKDIGHSRIYDRVLEKCIPVSVTGESRRKQNLKGSFFVDKEKLGL